MTRYVGKLAAALIAVTLWSCDDDFNTIGTDVVGDVNYGFERADYEITAQSEATGAVQSNNLDVNPLGVYSDPVFGKVRASFVTQLELDRPAPQFGGNPEVKSVILYVPYFSRLTEAQANGDRTFALDSVINPLGRFRLDVHRSGYYLRDTNEDLTPQVYYSDNTQIDAMKIGPRLNDAQDTESRQNDRFFYSNAEHRISTTDNDGNTTVSERLTPGMRLELNNAVFQEAVINAPAQALANNNAFKNHFRGLYFKASESLSDALSPLAMINFKGGTVTITYEEDGTGADAGVRVEKQLTLNLSGNTVSLLERENAPVQAPADRLYVKGGDGFVTKVDVLSEQDIEQMRNENWMINDATMTFYIDQAATAQTKDPLRLYLYDATNNRPLIDYYLDNTTMGNAKFNKYVHGGILETDEDDQGVRYKLNVTQYLRSVVNNDSTRVSFGLAVTESISKVSMARLKNESAVLGEWINTSSVMSPLGTVLYAPTLSPADPNHAKRPKLVVYYTKPE